MSLRDRVVRLVAIAAVAALIAGSVTGTLDTMRDEAWPGRGGMGALVFVSLLFSTYAFFLVALPVGALLAFTLSPFLAAMRFDGPLIQLALGMAIGLAVHLLVDIGIGEPIDRPQDFLGGLLAGGAAGLLWWFYVHRPEEEAHRHG